MGLDSSNVAFLYVTELMHLFSWLILRVYLVCSVSCFVYFF